MAHRSMGHIPKPDKEKAGFPVIQQSIRNCSLLPQNSHKTHSERQLILLISTKNVEKSRKIREMRKSTFFRLCYTKVVKTPIKICVNNDFLFIFT